MVNYEKISQRQNKKLCGQVDDAILPTPGLHVNEFNLK